MLCFSAMPNSPLVSFTALWNDFTRYMSRLLLCRAEVYSGGLWQFSVYHTVIVIKSKSCQFLLAKRGLDSLCSSNSPPSVWLDCCPSQYQTWHWGSPNRAPPQYTFTLFLILYDLAVGNQRVQIKWKYIMCVFVHVYKYDNSGDNPWGLAHTWLVFFPYDVFSW